MEAGLPANPPAVPPLFHCQFPNGTAQDFWQEKSITLQFGSRGMPPLFSENDRYSTYPQNHKDNDGYFEGSFRCWSQSSLENVPRS